jgi:hypothetical protein
VSPALLPRSLTSQGARSRTRDSGEGNARFPLGPSELAFAPNNGGSILNTTGPAPSGTFAGR